MLLCSYQVLSMGINYIIQEGLMCHWYQICSFLMKGAFPNEGHLFKGKYTLLLRRTNFESRYSVAKLCFPLSIFLKHICHSRNSLLKNCRKHFMRLLQETTSVADKTFSVLSGEC